MIDYTTLKHQADGTPTWDAFLGIILKVAAERQNWQSSELIQIYRKTCCKCVIHKRVTIWSCVIGLVLL